MSKLEESAQGDHRPVREALETAMQEFEATDESERKAFFHGMLTGYGVALNLSENRRKL
jgi:hypothetical protein